MKKPCNVVLIPTRGRWDRLDKLIGSWIRNDFVVILVTELDQESEAGQLYERWQHKILQMHAHPESGYLRIMYMDDKPGKGIGHVRNRIVEWCDSEGIEQFIMSDDDCYIAPNSPVPPRALLEACRAYPVLACAASHSQQNHFLGGLLESHPNEVVLAANGICFQMFAIDTKRAIHAGNFDPTLKVYEDSEFMRQGIVHGFPWSVHTGVRMVKTGRSGDSGGIQDYIDVEHRETVLVSETRNRLADRWGDDIISRPPKRPRQSWAKFYDRHMPGWRSFSAGHGGSLKNMLEIDSNKGA